MSKLKRLAQDTVIYGISSIVPRILNWFLVAFYTRLLPDVADYGIVTQLYAWTAILLVILTYGMETGYFRFANKANLGEKVYSTTIFSLAFTSFIFILLVSFFYKDMSLLLKVTDNPEFVLMLGFIVAFDAFSSIPFARLRLENRPIRFAYLKFIMVIINILANIFFLAICPIIYKSNPSLISWFFNPSYLLGYIFVSNVISTGFVVILLLPEILKVKFQFDWSIYKQILRYSWPLLIVGIAGIFNQSGDKLLYPYLVDNYDIAMTELGIYGANYKIAVIMVMFTQAFRFAFEPFIFNQQKSKDSNVLYAQALHWFVIIGLLVFVGITLFIDVVKFYIDAKYHSGLTIVPIILISNLFLGIFFSLSVWYKLTDKTIFGAMLALIGTIITVSINVIFVPKYGYIACAWGNFSCYFTIMVLSYLLGKRYYTIPYNIKKIGFYFLMASIIFVVHSLLHIDNVVIMYAIRTVLLALFISIIFIKEIDLRDYFFKMLKIN